MSAPMPVVPIWRHCWECMLEVTPSGRGVVLRFGPQVAIAPTTHERLAALCVSSRAARSHMEALAPWTPSIDWGRQ